MKINYHCLICYKRDKRVYSGLESETRLIFSFVSLSYLCYSNFTKVVVLYFWWREKPNKSYNNNTKPLIFRFSSI